MIAVNTTCTCMYLSYWLYDRVQTQFDMLTMLRVFFQFSMARFDIVLSMLTTFSCFGFILLMLIFSFASEIMILFPYSTYPPSFVVTKHNVLILIGPALDSCRSNVFVMKVSRWSRLVTWYVSDMRL